jgi:hypothetical protein
VAVISATASGVKRQGLYSSAQPWASMVQWNWLSFGVRREPWMLTGNNIALGMYLMRWFSMFYAIVASRWDW